ncbi:MAG: hypothetical protein R3Y28_03735 [Candidatus Gastranaerophilales bacterium]
MGKSKKRSLHLGINDRFSRLTRDEAVKVVVEMLEDGDKEVYSLITLFGLSAEEILEAGATYEAVTCMKGILK